MTLSEKIPVRQMLTITVLVLLTFILLCLLSTDVAKGTTIIVDDDGGQDYTSIQDAIDNATQGDTIRVWDGTYHEHILVDETVSLVGNGSEATTIDGDGGGDAVRIMANWVNVSRFGIQDAGRGVWIESDNNVISEMTIQSSGSGFFIKKGNYNRILSNTVTSCGRGLGGGGSYSNIAFNSFSDCTGSGVYLWNARYTSLENNSCNSNTDKGIGLGSGHHNTLKNNSCSLNGQTGIHLVLSTTDNELSNNDCSDNGKYGFHFSQSASTTTIVNCTSTNNGEYDLYLSSSRHNTCINTSFSTIRCNPYSDLTVKNYLHVKARMIMGSAISNVHVKIEENGNIIYASSQFGGDDSTTDSDGLVQGIPVTERIYSGSSEPIWSTATVEIWKNKWEFADNPRTLNMSASHTRIFSSLFMVADASGNGDYTCLQDAIDASKDEGIIHVWAGTYEENVIVDKTANLIGDGSDVTTIDGGGSGDVVLITADGVNMCGFHVTGGGVGNAGIKMKSDNNSITNNRCSDNADYGLYLSDSDFNTFHTNTISNNRIGIYLSGSSAGTVARYNSISDNTNYGIDASGNNGFTIDVVHSWWGDNSGPYHPEDNPAGMGDQVSELVLFDPWTIHMGPDHVYNRNKGTGYATISLAVADADAGNTIQIDGVEFTEDITISKQLTFTGNGKPVTLAGDIVVSSGGALSIRHLDLFFDCAVDGEHGLFVNAGGFSLSDSEINAINGQKGFRMVLASEAWLMNSKVWNMWKRTGGRWWWARGIEVYENEVVIDGCDIGWDTRDTSNKIGTAIFVSHASDVIIRNSSFEKCGRIGVLIDYSHGVVVDSCTFRNSFQGIYGHRYSSYRATDNFFYNVSADSITAETYVDAWLENSTFLECYTRRYYQLLSGTVTVYNTTVLGEREGRFPEMNVGNNANVLSINGHFFPDYIDIGTINSKLVIKNYLSIHVNDTERQDLEDGEVMVELDGDPIYATEGYGGSDEKTDASGHVRGILVTDKVYENSEDPVIANTTIHVKYEDIEMVRYRVNMIKSRTVYFDPNKPPVAEAGGPYAGTEGEMVLLDGSSSSDPDNDIVSYEWDLDGDGQYDDASGIAAQGKWYDDGTYVVGLRVTDSFGEYDTDMATIMVTNLAPTADFMWSPDQQEEGKEVAFTDLSTSSPDHIVSWLWDFGDGMGASMEQHPSYTYACDGVYSVTLTVADDDGSTDVIQHHVTILDLEPHADFSWSAQGPLFFEDWESGAINTAIWKKIGSPKPKIVEPGAASSRYSLDTNGDGWYNSGLISYEEFLLEGLSVSFLGKFDRLAPASHWNVFNIRISNKSAENTSDGNIDVLAQLAINYCDASGKRGSVICLVGDEKFREGEYFVDSKWHCYGMSVNPDGTVSFYVDGELRWTSSETIDTSAAKPVMLSGRSFHEPHYVDNITVSGPVQHVAVNEGDPIVFTDLSTSFPDNIVSWEWDFGDGTGTSTEQHPVYTYADDGVYSVTLTVTDDDGSWNSVTHTVTILDLGPEADFLWSPALQDEGSPVQFTDLSTSYPDVITEWAWDFGDGSLGSGPNPTHCYGDNGVYIVTLTVTDEDGSIATMCRPVSIGNVAPTVDAGDDQLADEDETLQFHGTVIDPGWLDTHTIEWDFGDGTVVTSTLTPTHEYEVEGEYTVTLTVTDDDGAADTDTLTVTVYDYQWHPPLAETEEFNAGRTLPIKFSLWKDGSFIRDESVQVTVTDDEGNVVFHAVYGHGDDHVRIDSRGKHYITNWHTDKEMRGEYTITVSFGSGLTMDKTIRLVGK